MTDSVHDTFDGLIERYESGVSQTDSDIIPALDARSAIEAQHDQLSEAQLLRVADADRVLVQNAEAFAPKVNASELAGSSHPSHEWWWHLDVVAPVTDYFMSSGGTPTGSPRSQLASRLFTALEVVVLIVAIFLLARNLGVFQPGATPTATAFPTGTPTIAPTVNAAAFDMTKATLFKAPNDVLEILLPSTWQSQSQPAATGNVYDFTYGDPQSPSVFVEVRLNGAQAFYKNIDPTGVANTPATVLAALIKSNSAGGQQGPLPKFSDVKPVKVGSLDGQGFTASYVASAQSPATEFDIRLAPIPNTDQLAYVISQGQTAIWAMAQPVVGKMLDSLVLKPQNVPTATPTATLFPLQITATALQSQFNALTPTSTPTLVGTGAATLGATTAATSGATSNVASTANATQAATTSANATVAGTTVAATTVATAASNSSSAVTMAATSSTNVVTVAAVTAVSAATAVPTSAATVAAGAGSVITTADGLKYTETTVSTGAVAKAGDTVRVRYTGKLTNGTVFDSSVGRSPDYIEFQLGAGNVIKGWDEGIAGMKVGGKRQLTIPPELGYGTTGQGPIPANATLIFDVELLSIQ